MVLASFNIMTVREILEAFTLFVFQTGTFVFIALRSPLLITIRPFFYPLEWLGLEPSTGRQAITGERREMERTFSGGSRIHRANLAGEEFCRWLNVALDMVCA
jgi:hypothetical protein